MTLDSFRPRMSKPSGSPVCLFQHIRLFPFHPFIFRYYHLRYSFPVIYHLHFCTKVYQSYLYFTTVIAVYRSRRIYHSQSPLYSQSAPWSYLRLMAFWYSKINPGWYQFSFHWLQGHRVIQPCLNIHASRSCSLVFRQCVR